MNRYSQKGIGQEIYSSYNKTLKFPLRIGRNSNRTPLIFKINRNYFNIKEQNILKISFTI